MDHARKRGFAVRRMPEDVARHIAGYYNYDFQIEKDGRTARVEVKSLWGTDGGVLLPDHVTQNPPIHDPPQNLPWFTDVGDVFDRLS